MAFAGETPCCTSKGYIAIEQLEGKEARVWDGLRWVAAHVEAVEMCGMVTVGLSNGVNLTCTPNVALKSAEEGKHVLPVFEAPGVQLDCISLPVVSGESEVPHAFLQGVYCASGTLVKVGEGQAARVVTLVGAVTREVEQHPDIVLTEGGGIDFPGDLSRETEVPLTATLQDKAEWLSGLLSSRYYYSDGGMCYATSSVLFARNLQLLLFSMGVHARVSQSAPLIFYQRIESTDLSVTGTSHVVEIAFDQLARLVAYGFHHRDVRPAPAHAALAQKTCLGVTADLHRAGKAYTFRDGEGKTFVLNGVLCMLAQ